MMRRFVLILFLVLTLSGCYGYLVQDKVTYYGHHCLVIDDMWPDNDTVLISCEGFNDDIYVYENELVKGWV
jgi:hypothetical protein